MSERPSTPIEEERLAGAPDLTPSTGGGHGAVLHRMTEIGPRFRWTVAGREVASAEWRGHCWELRDTDADEVVLTLVHGWDQGRTRVVLVDRRAGSTATFAPAEPMSGHDIGSVRDGDGLVVARVRAEGHGGLRFVDATGDLLAVTTRCRGVGSRATDVRVTAAGAARGTPFVLGLALALELLRTGRARRVA